MSMLPELRSSNALTQRQTQQAERAQRNTELAVFKHGLGARYRAEIDRLDGQATSDALRSALDEEIGLLDYGLARAEGSAAKVQLVARKVEMLAAINNIRISRRFGG